GDGPEAEIRYSILSDDDHTKLLDGRHTTLEMTARVVAVIQARLTVPSIPPRRPRKPPNPGITPGVLVEPPARIEPATPSLRSVRLRVAESLASLWQGPSCVWLGNGDEVRPMARLSEPRRSGEHT